MDGLSSLHFTRGLGCQAESRPQVHSLALPFSVLSGTETNQKRKADMSTISFNRIQAALRAMGIDKHEEVTSVVWEPHTVTVTRHALHNGKTYLDDYGDIATDTTVFTVDYAKDDADTYDGTGLTFADVKLVHDDGVVFDFHVATDVVYLADVGADGMIDIHLYGKGSASKSSASHPMPDAIEGCLCLTEATPLDAEGSTYEYRRIPSADCPVHGAEVAASQPMPMGEETPE